MRFNIFAAFLVIATVTCARAQDVVSNAWVRGTVPQQTTTGLFFDISSVAGGKIVAATTPVAREAQLHEMSMKGDVMAMREIQQVVVPRGTTVKFSPMSFHVMLIGLTHQLTPSEEVPAVLTIEDTNGGRRYVQVRARVEPLGATRASPPEAKR